MSEFFDVFTTVGLFVMLTIVFVACSFIVIYILEKLIDRG